MAWSLTSFDQTAVFAGVPAGLHCGACGSSDVSHSVLQPPDRLTAPFNPMAPFRCWQCWERVWCLKSPLELLLTLLLDGALLLIAAKVVREYCGRRRWIQRGKGPVDFSLVPNEEPS